MVVLRLCYGCVIFTSRLCCGYGTVTFRFCYGCVAIALLRCGCFRVAGALRLRFSYVSVV